LPEVSTTSFGRLKMLRSCLQLRSCHNVATRYGAGGPVSISGRGVGTVHLQHYTKYGPVGVCLISLSLAYHMTWLLDMEAPFCKCSVRVKPQYLLYLTCRILALFPPNICPKVKCASVYDKLY